MKPILITLISPSGSTRETAEHLAEALTRAGHEVVTRDLSPVTDWDAYSAVVVAAPIHGMKWLPEAVAWVETHREGLRGRPTALVAVSYLYFEGRANWKASILKGLEEVRAPLPHASVQVFPGRLPSALPTPARWLFGVKKDRPLDLVDPARIAVWAEEWAKAVR